MDTPKRITKKIAKCIANSFTQISSFIGHNSNLNDQEFYSPTASPEETLNLSENNVILTSFESNGSKKTILFDESMDWSKTMSSTNNSIILEKSDYKKIKEHVKSMECEIRDSKIKEDEYKKLLIDFDNTISYIIEREEENNTDALKQLIKEKMKCIEKLNCEIDKYVVSEKRLKDHIKSLERDLINSEDRAEAYRCIAQEKIDVAILEAEKLKSYYEFERSKNAILGKRVDELEKIVAQRCGENIELIEYCKILLEDN
jgi:hypothetical protein